MKNDWKPSLSFYDVDARDVETIKEDVGAYKITDAAGVSYFLKRYGIENDGDMEKNVRVYHTFEQLENETEILRLLSENGFPSPAPIRHKNGGFVTVLGPDADGAPAYAVMTTFLGAAPMEPLRPGMTDTAFATGQAAARLHLASEAFLLPVAAKRPPMRQDYVRRLMIRLAYGRETGALTEPQLAMLHECGAAVTRCMDQIDKQPGQTGLVHTDIISNNCLVAGNEVVLVDYTRSVYGYYLFDLAEMCLHGSFGGADPALQVAILRGYHSVKPLHEEDLLHIQTLFAMFIMTVMGQTIEDAKNAWLINTLEWFADVVVPGLVSGKGYWGVDGWPFET